MTFLRDRRDAEELHEVIAGQASPEVEQRHAALLRTVVALQSHRAVQPRADFSADLREQLLAAAATELVPAPLAPLAARSTTTTSTTTTVSPARRRLGTVAASLVIVGGTAGMAAAAQGALPGDPLYPIKRGGEQVVAVIAPGAPGAADLDRAGTRLAEAEALQARGADSDVVARSIDEFRGLAERGAADAFAAYRAGGDGQTVAAVRELSAAGVPQLDDLAAADPELRPAASEAAGALLSLDRQARELCDDCGSTASVALPESLSSTGGQAGAAATLASLLAVPALQAERDAEALEGLDAGQLRSLVQAAEGQVDQPSGTPGLAGPSLPGASPLPPEATSPRGAVSSTLTTVGGAAEGTVRGTTDAVDQLVGGLRDGVGSATGGLPRDGAAGTLTDTVDGALDGVSDVTGTLSGK